MKKGYRIALYIMVISFAFLAGLLRLYPIELMQLRVLDMHLGAMPATALPGTILIMGSDKSMADIGTWPWSREIWTELISKRLYLSKTIAMDVLFIDETTALVDEALAGAIADHGNVILGAHLDTNPRQSRYPIRPLMDAAAGIGFVNIESEADGSARRFRLAGEQPSGQGLLLSFPYAVHMANDGTASLGGTAGRYRLYGQGREIPVDEATHLYHHFVPNTGYEVYELSDVYLGRVPPETFQDALCIVGVSATGLEDTVTVPGGQMLSTRYLADCVSSIALFHNPPRAPSIIDAILCAFLFILCWLLSKQLPLRFGWLVPIVMSVGWFLLAHMLFIWGFVYLSSAIQMLSILAGYILALAGKLIGSKRTHAIQALSTDTLLRLADDIAVLDDDVRYDTYLSTFQEELWATSNVRIARALIKEAELENHSQMVCYKDARLNKKGFVFNIPLPTGTGEEKMYTVAASPRRLPAEVINSTAAFVISSYIYVDTLKESLRQQQALYSIVKCMSAAIDSKDPITSGHSQRVSDFAVQIAEWMGLEKKKVEQIRLAGIIHDIGKIGVPDSVLNKPGRLTEEEFDQMRKHPGKGQEIMRNIALPTEILDGIEQHHERLDGKGYPRGLSDREIGLTARVLKIADVYDALSSERQYKKAWPAEKVCDALYEGMGTEFDAEIVRLVLENIKPAGWTPTAAES